MVSIAHLSSAGRDISSCYRLDLRWLFGIYYSLILRSYLVPLSCLKYPRAVEVPRSWSLETWFWTGSTAAASADRASILVRYHRMGRGTSSSMLRLDLSHCFGTTGQLYFIVSRRWNPSLHSLCWTFHDFSWISSNQALCSVLLLPVPCLAACMLCWCLHFIFWSWICYSMNHRVTMVLSYFERILADLFSTWGILRMFFFLFYEGIYTELQSHRRCRSAHS